MIDVDNSKQDCLILEIILVLYLYQTVSNSKGTYGEKPLD